MSNSEVDVVPLGLPPPCPVVSCACCCSLWKTFPSNCPAASCQGSSLCSLKTCNIPSILLRAFSFQKRPEMVRVAARILGENGNKQTQADFDDRSDAARNVSRQRPVNLAPKHTGRQAFRKQNKVWKGLVAQRLRIHREEKSQTSQHHELTITSQQSRVGPLW